MAQELKLTRGEIERRMEEVEVDEQRYADVRDGIYEYLGSGIVGATNVGKHYTISDPKQREELADWVANLLVQSLRYERATKEDDDDDDE